jgi:TrmH family RNA methyltransferase
MEAHRDALRGIPRTASSIPVTARDATFQKFAVLQTNRSKRRRYGEFLVEGVRNINEAVRCGWRIASFLYAAYGAGKKASPIPDSRHLQSQLSAHQAGKRAQPTPENFDSQMLPTGLSGWALNLLETVETEINYALAPELMAELSRKDEPSELMALVKMRDEAAPYKMIAKARDNAVLHEAIDNARDEAAPPSRKPQGSNPLFVLFDRPSNKGNLGTLFRSCDSFGADCLFLTGHGVDPYEPEVITASMGSFFSVPFQLLQSNEQIGGTLHNLKRRYPALQIIGTTSHKKSPLWNIDLRGPVLFMIGNETDGLNHHLTGLCDALVTIPMSENAAATSLNVSCAASVLLYEAVRQQDINTFSNLH